MPDLPPSESSALPGAIPPPLPQKVRLFKLGWRLGFWFGIAQAALFLIVSVFCFLSPEGPPPLMMFVATAGAAIQAFSAHFISRNPNGGRSIFTVATVAVSFSYLIQGGWIFGCLNFIPLLLLVASSSPDVAQKREEDASLETAAAPSPSEPSSTKEDLY